MKKRMIIVLMCLTLVCSFAACDMELGGLVGELFGEGGIDIGDIGNIGERPIEPGVVPDHGMEETYTMGPGEELYGFPDSLTLPQDVIIFEASDGIGFADKTGAEIVDQAFVAMEDQFTGLYGYKIYHKQTLDTAEIILLAANEAQAGTGMPMLCYLPLSAAGEVALSGAFHSQGSLSGFELDNGCWSEQLNEDLRFDGVQYSFAGYLTPYAQLDVDCLLYYDDMMRELDYDICEAVNSGAWVFSEYLSLCTMVEQDLNGGDMFGAVYEKDQYESMFLGNSGVEIFTGCSYGEETISKCVTLYEDFAGLSRVTTYSVDAWEIFLSGNALFYATDLCRFAGLGEKGITKLPTTTSVSVVPMPMHFSDRYVANCDQGSFLSIGRSTVGDVGMALNVLSVLAANHMHPAVEQLLYKVNQNEDSVSMCFTVMESARCDLDRAALAAFGHEVRPLREGAASYMRAYQKEFEKALKEIYTAAQNNS